MSAESPRVLIVEDDAGVALLQRRRLERAGCVVMVADGVDAAMQRLAEAGADIVVLDYRLDDKTGLELQRRMTAAGLAIPVILVSGAMPDGAVIEALRAGVRDVILKSADYLDRLPEAVRGVLAQAVTPVVRARHGRAGRVLVVEDDPGIAALERRQLERAGYDVVLASGPQEAIEAVKGGDIGLAVLDLRLPEGVSGLDLYRLWRAEGWNIPAILVTAFADQTVAIGALRAGIRDFVPKSDNYLDHLPAAVDRVFEQVRVERKLIESELRLASVIGTTMDAIVMCDEAGVIVLFNWSAEKMFGCAADAAVGRPLSEFVPGLRFDGAAPGELRERQEVEGRRADGSVVPVEISVSDVVVHGERLFTVIGRDVSERNRIEAELREADRRKDQFLGMLAHELRNPLAAVMSAGDVLYEVAKDERTRHLTDVVRRQARALSRMVDDLLDVSRITLGKIQLTCGPVELGDLVRRAAAHAADHAAAAGLTLEVSAPPGPVWLEGDSTRLDQVLGNLLSNALKFTPSGGQVRLDAAVEDGQAVLRVRDTGIGIPADLLPHVFDLFVQADTSLDRSKSGLGIGLALVRQLVRLHGGEVSVSSAGPDAGAEFAVRLPLRTTAAALVAEPRTEAQAQAPRRLRVLVVDDQPDNADLFQMLVEVLGHEARAVYDGASALQLAREQPPDVMFVDVGMPIMNGYEVARTVRADAALAGVRLVAVTGYGRSEDRAKAAEAGFDRHLVKPVDDARLRALLDEFAGGPSSGVR